MVEGWHFARPEGENMSDFCAAPVFALACVGLSAVWGSTAAEAAGSGSSITNYWYGGSLHPLVVERKGVNYLLIGKQVVEAVGSSQTRSYLIADRLGSVRVVTDADGKVALSLGYDGDYGATRIEGQSYPAVDDSMASFYRFQGQEQETFPLSKLGIEDDALATWLDQLQLYHFPWRDYASGLAVFTQTDPVPADDSLYAALGANPVNHTDETGGMMNNFPATYRPLHRNVPQGIQTLLDAVQSDPGSLGSEQIDIVWNFYNRVFMESYNPYNPYDTELYYLALEAKGVPDELIPARLDRLFQNLLRERDTWLERYRVPLAIARLRSQGHDVDGLDGISDEEGPISGGPADRGIVGLDEEEQEILFLSSDEDESAPNIANEPVAADLPASNVEASQATQADADASNIDPEARASLRTGNDLVERSEQQEEEEKAETWETKGKEPEL
jgi:hypothetical protein